MSGRGITRIDREVDAFEALRLARERATWEQAGDSALLIYFISKAVVLALLEIATSIRVAGRVR